MNFSRNIHFSFAQCSFCRDRGCQYLSRCICEIQGICARIAITNELIYRRAVRRKANLEVTSIRWRKAKNASKAKKSQQTAMSRKKPFCALLDEEKPVSLVTDEKKPVCAVPGRKIPNCRHFALEKNSILLAKILLYVRVLINNVVSCF